MKPTRRPTPVPTARPTSRPSSQPTSQPTNPTGQPTSQPSYDRRIIPELVDLYPTEYATYICHPLHIHSTPNPFTRIYAKLALNSTVTMARMTITISPYNPEIDKFSLLGDVSSYGVKTTMTRSGNRGVFEISAYNRQLALTLDDWRQLINFPAYKLDLERQRPNSCNEYVRELYPRLFTILIFDRYERVSKPIYRKLLVRTAAVVYSNAKPVKINNHAAYLKLVASQASRVSVTGDLNLTDISYPLN